MYGYGYRYNSGLVIGAGGGGGGSYLVDDYSPIVAYSVNKISSTATLCCRVRRASDNAEQDIGFVGDVIDTASIETFVGFGNDAFITSIYNQGTGGGIYDLNNPVLTNQGRVFYSVASPYFSREKSTGVYIQGLTPLNPIITKTMFSVAKSEVLNIAPYFVHTGSFGFWLGGSDPNITGFGGYDGSNIRNLVGEDLLEHLSYFNLRTSKLYVSKDGGAETDTGAFATSLLINRVSGGNSGNVYFHGYFKEVVIFDVDESANREAIRDNQNSRFLTY